MKAVISLLISLFCFEAFATLGEQSNHQYSQIEKAQSPSGYRINESTIGGSLVREYTSLSGQVFAVTWLGVKQPDLSSVFGKFYSEFQMAEKSGLKHKNNRASNIKTRDLVVSRSGHMRSFHGTAYVPNLLPKGFNLRDLK